MTDYKARRQLNEMISSYILVEKANDTRRYYDDIADSVAPINTPEPEPQPGSSDTKGIWNSKTNFFLNF